jgi:peptide/nickel transport system permease protein
MTRFLLGKAPSVIFVLFVSSIVAFALPRLAPGDVAVVLAGPDPTAQDIETIREQLGLNDSLVVQYWHWIAGLVQGDLGESFLLRRSVASLIGDRIGSTLQLAVASTILVVLIGGALGILAASARHSWARTLLDVTNSVFIAVPSFLVGLVLILVFGVFNVWLPVSGEVDLLTDPYTGIQFLILPALALALTPAAVVARFIQTEMLAVRNAEFVDLAVAKGASPRRVTFRHILRNSLGSAVVGIGLQAGQVLAGAVIIEAIFARNGLGELAVSSVQSRDFTVLQVLIVGAVFIAVLCQLVTEIILAALDPRIRLGA